MSWSLLSVSPRLPPPKQRQVSARLQPSPQRGARSSIPDVSGLTCCWDPGPSR